MQESTNAPLRVLISGGGTGGHIFPALSIADAIRRRDPRAEILFVGAEGRMEMERVPAAGYEIIGLPVAGFDRRHLWRNIGVLFKLFRSMRKARRIVTDFRPDVAVGVGGYASGPVLKAAQRAGVPTVLQEQNSYPGVTNKLLAKNAVAVCVAYPDLERFFPADKIVMTGNPVRRRLLECDLTPEAAKEALGFKPDLPLVLFVGGSLGAGTLNDTVVGALKSGRALRSPFNVLWQTGRSHYADCADALAEHPADNVRCTEFISDMAIAYRAADLVVARAGAGTISELELLGKPAILVPSPNVAEDHQRHNAEALATRGAAGMVLDADATEKLWGEAATVVENPDTLAILSRNIAEMALPDSDDAIARIVMEAARR